MRASALFRQIVHPASEMRDVWLGLLMAGPPGIAVQQASAAWQDNDASQDESVSPETPDATAVTSDGDERLQLTALQLRFQLPPSAYATMAIRQVYSLVFAADCPVLPSSVPLPGQEPIALDQHNCHGHKERL